MSWWGSHEVKYFFTSIILPSYIILLPTTWWLIPLSRWVITPVINGISRVNPLITGVITHLLSGMSYLLPIIISLPCFSMFYPMAAMGFQPWLSRPACCEWPKAPPWCCPAPTWRLRKRSADRSWLPWGTPNLGIHMEKHGKTIGKTWEKETKTRKPCQHVNHLGIMMRESWKTHSHSEVFVGCGRFLSQERPRAARLPGRWKVELLTGLFSGFQGMGEDREMGMLRWSKFAANRISSWIIVLTLW